MTCCDSVNVVAGASTSLSSQFTGTFTANTELTASAGSTAKVYKRGTGDNSNSICLWMVAASKNWAIGGCASAGQNSAYVHILIPLHTNIFLFSVQVHLPGLFLTVHCWKALCCLLSCQWITVAICWLRRDCCYECCMLWKYGRSDLTILQFYYLPPCVRLCLQPSLCPQWWQLQLGWKQQGWRNRHQLHLSWHQQQHEGGLWCCYADLETRNHPRLLRRTS